MVGVDVEQIKRDLMRFSSNSLWKPSPGPNRIRILPPWDPGRPIWYFPVTLHYVEGKGSFMCTGNDCVICKILADPAIAVKLSGKVSTNKRFLANILDANDLENVRVWPMPLKVWADINRLFLDPQAQWGDITDPDNGRFITIIREGTGMTDTRYQVIPDANPSPIPKHLLSDLFDLSQFFRPASPENLSGLSDFGIQIDSTVGTEPLDSPPFEPAAIDAPQSTPNVTGNTGSSTTFDTAPNNAPGMSTTDTPLNNAPNMSPTDTTSNSTMSGQQSSTADLNEIKSMLDKLLKEAK